MQIDPWQLLRNGESSTSLDLLEAQHRADSDHSSTMELGVAYLWAHQYEKAYEHFHAANEASPLEMDSFYQMSGIAKWCLNDYDSAFSEWQDGTNCSFTDPGGTLSIPLLVFAAATIRPRNYSATSAKKTLSEKAANTNSEMWPRPLADFALQRINEFQLCQLCQGADEAETDYHRTLSDFYVGIKKFGERDMTGYRSKMLSVADTSLSKWSDEQCFFSIIWSGEYFIARHYVEFPTIN